MTSYLEQMAHDTALRAFVDAQRGHDAVELAALKVVCAQQQDVIEDQKNTIARLEQQAKRRKV